MNWCQRILEANRVGRIPKNKNIRLQNRKAELVCERNQPQLQPKLQRRNREDAPQPLLNLQQLQIPEAVSKFCIKFIFISS